jgi:8-oxo-dGTP pyrophosphatase MutT (NUDIX family)
MIKPPRESSTVLLLRETPTGPEVFMVRRHLNSDFVGGAYVFPGGALDEADCEAETLAYLEGLSEEAAANRLEIPVERALGHWCAALRETFEEAGVLLAYQAGRPLVIDSSETCSHWAMRRQQLLDKQLDWGGLLALENLTLACDALHYFAHWITPVGVGKRFTTRFFAAMAPADQIPLPDEREVDLGIWLHPQAALERQKRGEITLILPTRKTLEDLSAFETASAFLADCQKRHVVALLPRVTSRNGHSVIVLPGEPGYESAVETPGVTFDPSLA